MFPRSRRRLPFELFVIGGLLLAVAASSCTYRPHHHRDDDPYYDVWEDEPNDSHCCPDVAGTFYVNDELVIGGRIRDDASDPFDGFACESGEPLDLHFVLEPVDVNADLDLCVWDPELGDFAFCFESPSSVESGVFSVPEGFRDFHLVVSSYSGDAEYRLTVWAEPVSYLQPLQGAPSEAKRARAVPLEHYGPERIEALVEHEPRVLGRAVLLEIDSLTGALTRRAIAVREDGVFVGPAR